MANEGMILTKGNADADNDLMEVQFTAEQQAQLARIASRLGTEPETLVTKVVLRYLAEEVRFLAAVEKGIAEADRGEFAF
jgi:predicted transcriptional regulator